MNYRVDTPDQLKAVIRALRKTRGLNQTELGTLLGVSQRRVATIEKAPGVTSFDQIARLVSALGGRLSVEIVEPVANALADPSTGYDRKRSRKPKSRAEKAAENGAW
jgi:Predicted transcriptional regulators